MKTTIVSHVFLGGLVMSSDKVLLKPISKAIMKFRIRGTSPLITHQWSEKAKREMREKHQGKKTKNRDVRVPQEEFEAAAYKTSDGKYGVPGMAIKNAIVTAAHKNLGIERTMVRKALFLKCEDVNNVIPLIAKAPVMREDLVRVGNGAPDLRYRPMWAEWACDMVFEVDTELLTKEDVLALVNRAGFGVGICEWRPEKDGEYGRFEIDSKHKIEVIAI
jgi:protein required for attachment to host cells